MRSQQSLVGEVKQELRRFFLPPRQFLQTLIINAVISLLFFLVSYHLGNYDTRLLPIAAATILLWTLADASITNQLLYDRAKAARELKAAGTVKRLLLVKNLAIVVVSIPLTVIFGLILVALVGSWSEIIYGFIVTFALIWGWLGISNALSVVLPFELLDLKAFLKNRRIWIGYSMLYGLPWVLLPVYAILMSVPFILLGWTKASATHDHKILTTLLLLSFSLILWQVSLAVVDHFTAHPKSRIKKLIY